MLLHAEIQTTRQQDFAARMYGYYVRLREQFGRPVISVALLIDGNRHWRPRHHEEGGEHTRLVFSFTMIKILDWQKRLDDLLAQRNPFAIIIHANLAALATRGRRAGGRFERKVRTMEALLGAGYAPEQVDQLLRFADWVLELPPAEAAEFRSVVRSLEERAAMPYVTSFERLDKAEGRSEGLAEGRSEGLAGGLAVAVEVLHGKDDPTLADRVRACNNIAVLEAIAVALRGAHSAAEIRALLEQNT